MAKPQQNQIVDMAPDMLPGAGQLVTYLPKDGDPPKVRWGRVTFHANVGQMISDAKLLAKAKANKWFHVGDGAPRVEIEETAEPRNSDQYRAHVAKWLPTVQTASHLDEVWAGEEMLRRDCGVGGEDLELLDKLLLPRRAELRRAEMPG